jgi:hypothetical protein
MIVTILIKNQIRFDFLKNLFMEEAIQLLKELKNTNKNWIPDYNENQIKNIINNMLSTYNLLQSNLK